MLLISQEKDTDEQKMRNGIFNGIVISLAGFWIPVIGFIVAFASFK